MAPNVLLLRQVLEQIEAHPDTWDQGTYRCATGMCFAGWAAQLAGGRWVNNTDLLHVDVGEVPFTMLHGIEAVGVASRARRVLGLASAEAGDLFDTANDLDDIRTQVAVLIAQVHHVTIRIVPHDELILGEATPDGRSPLEVMEHRPGQSPMFHGGELGIALDRLADHARVVANRLGVPYIDPIDPAAMKRLARGVAA